MTQIKNDDFLTIITRNDLTPGYKVVQSAHALADFSVKYRHEFCEWQSRSNFLCCLEASKSKIDIILSKLDLLKIKYSVFLEPDIGNEFTSVAIEALPREVHKKLFKTLKLTLS